MFAPAFLAKARQHLAVATSLFALIANLGAPLPAAAEDHDKHGTSTPIQHLIVIIGENRTFDHHRPLSGNQKRDSAVRLLRET